jgi:hypothetical protein
MDAREHLKDNKMIYAILVAVGGIGGAATITDNLPVTQAEFRVHNSAPHVAASQAIEKIQGSLDVLVLQQLRDALRQAYLDKCTAADPQAITYINAEIEDLQDSYVALTRRRFEPPPCEVAE